MSAVLSVRVGDGLNPNLRGGPSPLSKVCLVLEVNLGSVPRLRYNNVRFDLHGLKQNVLTLSTSEFARGLARHGPVSRLNGAIVAVKQFREVGLLWSGWLGWQFLGITNTFDFGCFWSL